MRVLIDVKDNPTSGKGHFLNRLAHELPNHGVEVVSEGKHDIYLGVNQFKHKTKAPKVLRVNGCYNDKARPFKKMNETIAVQCRKADGIIYQSQWSKQMHQKYVGKYKVPSAVIFNGSFQTKGVDFANGFVAVSRWRPHKRLKDIITAFDIADTGRKLHVYGDTPMIGRVPNVVYHGKVFANELFSAFNQANASIHICYLDACPNSVVESLMVGCPVITNNVGGTQELIMEGCGEVCEIDEPYDMRPVKLYKPPPVDHNVIAQAMWDSLKWPRVTNNAHVDIVNIAKQYKSFFEDVLNG